MKMRKLLATAVAASLAVTSLATVASAAEKTFQMGQTTGTIDLTSTGGYELGGDFSLSQEQIDNGETLGFSATENKLLVISVGNGAMDKITGATLNVTGVKGTRGNSTKTYSYAFTNYNDIDGTSINYNGDGKYYGLWAYTDSAAAGSFIPSQFVEITKVEVVVNGTRSETTATAYDAWGNTTWYADDGACAISFDKQFGTWNGDILNQIDMATYQIWGANYAGTKSTSVVYPFLPKTGDDTLTRDEIRELSSADDYNATGNDKTDVDGDQSYNGDDTTAGTAPVNFAGLASQVADFFNKQTNGTITFTFTAPAAAAAGSDWQTGGIPSTQTGIKNTLGAMSTNDIALFFNYDKTGSLQAVTALDTAAASVTFDISDVLDALGGQTMGVLDDIYYGLNKGITYDGVGTGLYVEKVTLAYADDADVEADIEDDAEIEDDTTVEEDDDVALEDDAEDEAPVEDDADEETDGDVIVETEDDDANPGTGVALAVVPALVAAAAVVVSKKRS